MFSPRNISKFLMILGFLLLTACGGGSSGSESNKDDVVGGTVDEDGAGGEEAGGGNADDTTGDAEPMLVLPHVPLNVQAQSLSSSQVRLSWQIGADGDTVATYHVYRNDALVASIATTQYDDEYLFADTAFEYRVSAANEAGESSLTASVAVRTDAFVVEDVQVGDSAVNYANVEFTSDGRFVVWFEQDSVEAKGRGVMWHCEIDPDTAAFIPSDCKGYRAYDSTLWGRANVGRDANGVYYTGIDRQGNVILVRPTSYNSGMKTVLSTPADPRRRAIYPSDLPTTDKRYVLWILNEEVPGSATSVLNDWYELQYVDLDDPETIHSIERQASRSPNMTAMDIGFVRWYRASPKITYGAFSGGKVQVKEFDVTSPEQSTRFVTNDNASKIDPYPFVYGNADVMMAGDSSYPSSNVYRRGTGESMFTLTEVISVPGATTLLDPALAQSNESIVVADELFTAYQVNERGGGFQDTAFLNKGEIWLSTVLQDQQQQWRISANNDDPKAEPEPYIGNNKVWVFYNVTEGGDSILNAHYKLQRSATPLGAR